MTSITTHMVERGKMLFAPILAPDHVLWDNAYGDHIKWTKAKHDLLTWWGENKVTFHNESQAQNLEERARHLNKLHAEGKKAPKYKFQDRYLEERALLLNKLHAGGEKAHKSLIALERSFRWTSAAGEAAKGKGVKIDVDKHTSYVHVSKSVMDVLDEIYVNTFRAEEGEDQIQLQDCFTLTSGSQAMEAKQQRFKAYLEQVTRSMESLLKPGSEMDAAYAAGSPQAHGLAGAIERLQPLFYPVQGRICLPLPTVSMLEDLKECVLMDPKVICEVRSSVIPRLKTSPINRTIGRTLVRRPWGSHDSCQRP